jgi:hypothetical protein
LGDAAGTCVRFRRYWAEGFAKGVAMRALTMAVAASILLNLAAAAQDRGRDAVARTPPPPAATTGAATAAAPVGHRQPTQDRLPPAVRQKEESITRRPADPLGPIPKICSDC